MSKPKKPKKKRVNPKSATSPLVDRDQAAEILNYSYVTIRRMEADGALTPVKLRGDRPSKTFYRKHQVYALIGMPLPD